MNASEGLIIAVILFAVSLWAAAVLDWLTAVTFLAMGWAATAIAIRANMRKSER